MGRKTKRYVLVSSESGDWYVIPADKVGHWWDEGCYSDDDPEVISYAHYVRNPSHVSFCDWKEVK